MWLTLLSTPFFLPVPAAARRTSSIGRLPVVSVASLVTPVGLLVAGLIDRQTRSTAITPQ